MSSDITYENCADFTMRGCWAREPDPDAPQGFSLDEFIVKNFEGIRPVSVQFDERAK